MSRHDKKYTTADMLDAYHAGREHYRNDTKPNGDYPWTAFFDWLENLDEQKAVQEIDKVAEYELDLSKEK